MSNNLSDYQFVFNIKSPHWDEEPNTWKNSRPVGLDTLVDFGMSTELDFADGGTLEIKDIDWEVDEVIAGLWTDDHSPEALTSVEGLGGDTGTLPSRDNKETIQ